MEEVERILIYDSHVYDSISTSLHALFSLEFAIGFPENSEDYSFDDGLLVISESLAARILQKNIMLLPSGDPTESRRCALIISLLLPEHPCSCYKLLTTEEVLTQRCNSLALRFHINSSVLWRIRMLLCLQDSNLETDFVSGLSDFKKFNYHLFYYWTNLVSSSNLMDIHIPFIARFIRANPSNFSPYHILIEVLRSHEGGSLELLRQINDFLALPEYATSKDAYKEFICSCGVLLKEKGVRVEVIRGEPLFHSASLDLVAYGIMSSINLPWESENIVEWSKGQLVVDATSSPVVTTLISSLKNPTQFAIIVTLDEEKPPEAPSAQVGFLAKIKNMASNAASQAVSAKRQMTAGANRLASVYDVKYVIPIACNVEFSITAGSLIVSWAQLPPTRGEPVRREIRINNLSNKFVNVFNATKEISLVKEKVEFGLNGNTTVFNWLWKYQPIQPVPIDPEMPPANLSIAPAQILGRILCLTWNVAGLPPPDDNPMNVLPSSFTKYKTSLVAFLKRHDVEIVILSLQEASPLNAKTVLFKSADDNYGEAWMEWFGDVLNCSGPTNKADWVKTTGIIQVGLAVAMFVKNTDENKVARVTAPMTSCVKTGTLGLTGNKGCVGLRSKVSFPGGPVPLSVSVLNVHLASGEGKCDFRKNELMKVANESSFGEDKSTHFFDSEFCVVTGDLNSRVNDEQIDGGGNEIPADDELLTRMREEGNAFMYNENEIRFPATYKLVPGEEGRLVFHMNRKPGWCDRVLFRSAPLSSTKVRFHCVEYNSLRELDLSDHTPVYAVFALGESLKADHQDAPLRSQPRTTSPSLTTRDEPEFKINDSVEDDDDDDDSDLYDNN